MFTAGNQTQDINMLRSIGNVEAARARAESFFSSPARLGPVDVVAAHVKAGEDAVRERTAKLREARLAKEAAEREAAPARGARRHS